MSKSNPAWLPEARELCRKAGITIVGWGPETLTVEAKSADRAKEFAAQLAQLGFTAVANEDDADAGLLDLSLTAGAGAAPASVRPPRYRDFTRRPFLELLAPVLELALSLSCLWFSRQEAPPRSQLSFALGVVMLLLFFWDGARLWGWQLQLSDATLRIRRYFRWTEIPWSELRAVRTSTVGRYAEAVILERVSRPPLKLGRFSVPFARALRDRLRQQIPSSRVQGASS